VSKALSNIASLKPCKLLLEIRQISNTDGNSIGSRGTGGGGGGGASPLAPKGASNLSLITSTGGINGTSSLLLVPIYITHLQKFVFASFDPTNFNCEEDCFYNFKMEDMKLGRNVDVHKVYLQYRDLGKVTFTVSVSAMLLNRKTNKSTLNNASKDLILGTGDGLIHSKFIDLKVQGERPQLSITRKANNGPLSIIAAMLVGNMAEEEQL